MDVALETLVARDAKDLYGPAMAGEGKDVVGVDIPFVAPRHADLVLDNNPPLDDVARLVDRITAALPEFA